MPKLSFTQDEVNDYLKGKRDCLFRKQSVDSAFEMEVHADGIFPEHLLHQRRPNEPLEVLEYRKKIWKPITRSTFGKVFSSLQKIRRAQDWSIQYEDLDQFSRIAEGEDLQSYCETDFPFFGSLTNWTFSILLRKYMIDSNAVVFTMPLDQQIDINDYREPFPEIFDSRWVIDFRDEDYVVLERGAGCYYYDEQDLKRGRSFIFVTTQYVWQYDQTDKDMNFKLAQEYEHGLGLLPAYKIGGVLLRQTEQHFLYQTRIADMLPELDEAVREYSDLQAAKVLHIYPERWEYSNNECTTCKGTGKRINPHWTETCNCEHEIECERCHGHGYVVAGPYSKILVKPNSAVEGGSQVPMPPAGYIQKDVEVLKVQQQGVDAHQYKALAAINFQFLDQTPLNQSGNAKEVDKDELNNTVSSIAEDLVATMDKQYRIIAQYRYKDLYSADDIDEMLPETTVPQVFDLLSTQNLEDELINSRKNNVNPVILNAMETDYAAKRFNNAEVRDMVALTLELDPLSNVAETDKVLMLQNEGITQATYVMSSNIYMFIQQAMEKDKQFVSKTTAQQREVITKMAQDQIDVEKASKKVNAFMVNGGNGLNNNNGNIQPNPSNDNPGGGQVPPANTGAAGANAGSGPGSAQAA